MINTIIYHVPYRIYDNPLITESGDLYFYAEDVNEFPFILVYDRKPITPMDYRNPKAIRNPAIVIPNMIMAMDAIGDEIRDEIRDMSTEIYGIKTLISEMRLMSTADMYAKVIADMFKRLAKLRASMDHYHKWIDYLERIGKMRDDWYA